MPYGHASMLLLGEGSEATEPYNKYDKIRPHSIRSLQFDQKVRPLSFRQEKFDLFTATQQLSTVIVVAGFNDHRKSPATFVENWKYIVQLIYWKFNPSTVIITKTIATANDSITNRRIYWLNFALHKLLGSLNLPIVSPNFNRDFDTKIFCRDGVHFSFFGNHIFTRILSFYISLYSCNFIHM